MRIILHIFLACMLAVCSPAWCACAFATSTAAIDRESADDGCGETCCPTTDEHDGTQLPCRDRSDCLCCDGAVNAPVATAKDITGSPNAMSLDLTPIPACISMIALEAPSMNLRPESPGFPGAPPLPAESSSLLARRCLLLI